MVVVLRIDLDMYDLNTIEKLVCQGLITMGEATESREVRKMNDIQRLIWIRATSQLRTTVKKAS